MMKKSYLAITDVISEHYPEAVRCKNLLLRDKHGTVIDVFQFEKSGKFLLIIDYRYAIYRPDNNRFFKEPWLEVEAFQVDEPAFEKSVEVLEFESAQARELEFSRLLYRLEAYPGEDNDHGFGGEDFTSPVPLHPLPPRFSAGNEEPFPDAEA